MHPATDVVRRGLLRVGAPLLAASLGIAVQVSAVRGAIIETGAWVAVAIGGFLTVMGSFVTLERCAARKRRRASGERHFGQGEFGRALLDIGDQILRFKHDQDSQAPRPTTGPESIFRPWRTSRARHEHEAALGAHELDTMSLYDQRFGADVRSVISELLHRRMIGRNEAQLLLGPEDPAAIEHIALRLIELGKLYRRRQSAA